MRADLPSVGETMTVDPIRPEDRRLLAADFQRLRVHAEEILRHGAPLPGIDSAEAASRLAHELHVSYAELEIQNGELRAAYYAIESAQRQYLELFDAAPFAALVIDANGIVKLTNARARTYFGDKSVFTQIDQPLTALVEPEHHGALHSVLARGWSRSRAQAEVRLRTATGMGAPWVQLECTPIDDLPGQGNVLLVQLADISQRRDAERMLEESEVRFRSIVSTAPDGILVWDREWRIETVNPAALRLFGAFEDGFIGRDIRDFIPLTSRSPTTASPDSSERVVMLERMDGSTFPAEISRSELALGDGPRSMAVIRSLTPTLQAGT